MAGGPEERGVAVVGEVDRGAGFVLMSLQSLIGRPPWYISRTRHVSEPDAYNADICDGLLYFYRRTNRVLRWPPEWRIEGLTHRVDGNN